MRPFNWRTSDKLAIQPLQVLLHALVHLRSVSVAFRRMRGPRRLLDGPRPAQSSVALLSQPSLRSGFTFERTPVATGDPTAVERTRLWRHALPVDEAAVERLCIKGDKVLGSGRGPTREGQFQPTRASMIRSMTKSQYAAYLSNYIGSGLCRRRPLLGSSGKAAPIIGLVYFARASTRRVISSISFVCASMIVRAISREASSLPIFSSNSLIAIAP